MTTPKSSPASTPTNEELHRRRANAVPRGVSNLLAVYAERARNAELWDVEGRRYVDFASGIAVVNTGHVHPQVKAAVAHSSTRSSHGCFQVTPYESYIALAERLNAARARPDAEKDDLSVDRRRSGGERHQDRALRTPSVRAVIAFSGGFHGRTLGCIALTGKVQPYKAGFGPMPPEMFHVPFPIAYHGVTPEDSLRRHRPSVQGRCRSRARRGDHHRAGAGRRRVLHRAAGIPARLRALCDKHGILLIADEIQTGFARTGKMFAIEHSGIEPDLMTVAKSIAGGVPLSAVIGKAEIMDAPVVGASAAPSPVHRWPAPRVSRCSK